ncbi:hypothetical protein N7504_010139 [Penicillium tannophilum]|nr:hypothetical protein N7504_010139 [Penicillium tannophilum]
MSQVSPSTPQGQLLDITPSELELKLLLRDIECAENIRTLLRHIQSAEDAQALSEQFELEVNKLQDELQLEKIELERKITAERQLLYDRMRQRARVEWELRIRAEETVEVLKKQHEDLNLR